MTSAGIFVLTSEEKWDRTKTTIMKWHERVSKQEPLDFRELRSDRGFLAYVGRAYPFMVPYFKGFHLSLESWRDGRDSEG